MTSEPPIPGVRTIGDNKRTLYQSSADYSSRSRVWIALPLHVGTNALAQAASLEESGGSGWLA